MTSVNCGTRVPAKYNTTLHTSMSDTVRIACNPTTLA
jgi:hypothetical protein